MFAQAREVAEASRKLKDANVKLAEMYERTKELDELGDKIIREIRATVFGAQTRPARRPMREEYRLILQQSGPGDA